MSAAEPPADLSTARKVDGHRHVRHLDGLRGVAILMVLAVHVSGILSDLPQPVRDLTFYGVRGVQLFFIVSGLTLALTHAGRPFHAADFFTRRFFRIAPMFYLGALFYLLIGATTKLSFAPRDVHPGEVLETLAFVHSWSFTAHNKIVPGGWSIGCEAMFYLLFPFLAGQVAYPRRMAAVTAGSYLVAGATYWSLRHWLPGEPVLVQSFAFDFWLSQVAAFVTGCWLATGPGRSASRRSAIVIGWLALAGLIIDSQLRGHSNLLVATGLLGALVWSVGQVRPRLLESRFMTRLGEVSFSVYLIHFAVVAILEHFAPSTDAAIGSAASLLLFFLITLAVAGSLAILTFRFVEAPGIRIGRSLIGRDRPGRT